MAQSVLKIFVFMLVFLRPTFIMSCNFNVIQPKFQYVNSDKTASITCQHDAKKSTLRDVRLIKVQNEKIICQKGLKSCPNIIMDPKNDREYVFTLKNVGLEQMKFTYQCEMTVVINDVDCPRRGTPTQLLYNFTVTQPQFQDINPDRTASISCEHDAEESTIQDVRLYKISKGSSNPICQKGVDNCTDIVHYQKSSTKFVFILLNVGPEAMMSTYQCEITVKLGHVNNIRKGNPTKLKEEVKDCSSNEVRWILIGLLVVMFLYGCVITWLYLRLTQTVWKNMGAVENSTYVIMKPPAPNNQYEGIYDMQVN